MGKNNNSKDSADILAQAMKRVFKEAVEDGVGTLRKDVGTLRKDVGTLRKDVGTLRKDVGTLRKDMERGLKTTDQNVQKQLYQHRKDVTSDLKKALGKG